MAGAPLTDYPEDVLRWMRAKEDQHPKYRRLSPQLSVRGSLVDFIRHVCEELKLSVLTTHLGVHLLDRFMDAHNIVRNQLMLSALSVLLLAAKFEESEDIPRVSQLNAFAEGRYSLYIFNKMETFMLEFFDWNVGTVTPAHFMEFFLMYGITPEDFSEDKVNLSHSSEVHRKLWFSAQHYLDISIQDTKFLQWKSSKVAAACLVCGRIQTRLLPTWPQSLEEATGYPLKSLSSLIDTLLRLSELEERLEPCRTPESGYRSGNSSVQTSPTTPQN